MLSKVSFIFMILIVIIPSSTDDNFLFNCQNETFTLSIINLCSVLSLVVFTTRNFFLISILNLSCCRSPSFYFLLKLLNIFFYLPYLNHSQTGKVGPVKTKEGLPSLSTPFPTSKSLMHMVTEIRHSPNTQRQSIR